MNYIEGAAWVLMWINLAFTVYYTCKDDDIKQIKNMLAVFMLLWALS